MRKQEESGLGVFAHASSPTGSARPPGGGASSDVRIGRSVVVKGEVHGYEDVTIEGQVEGTITLKEHVVTIGTHGRVRADVVAKSVVIRGDVVGNIEATERVAISAEGSVEGDIKAGRVVIAEGARFRGGIDMNQGQADHAKEEPGPASEPRRAPAARKP